jgi:hypothetical protein
MSLTLHSVLKFSNCHLLTTRQMRKLTLRLQFSWTVKLCCSFSSIFCDWVLIHQCLYCILKMALEQIKITTFCLER